MKIKPLTVKRILYTFCFVALCVIDQIKGSADGRVQMVAVNCTGFVIAAIILSAYKLKDFYKLPYLIWTVIFAIGGTIAYLWGKENYPYIGQWITAILNVGVYGFILIRTFYKLVIGKNIPELNKVPFTIWIIMMLGMILSRNEAIWPLWFLVMFGCFYVTDYNEEERAVLLGGLIDGLIMGFFLIQGAAFVFRPYDQLRYLGMYANENMNGLFYAVTYCACLCKWHQLRQKKAKKFLQILAFCLAGTMFGFAFLTMGRTALLTMVVTTIFFLLYDALGFEKGRIKGILGKGTLLILVAAVTFPLVFGSVRYLPPVFHHPIWFNSEYSEARVHSWDPVNSQKYTDFDEFLNELLGRVLWFADIAKEEARQMMRPSMVAHAAENIVLVSEQDELNNTGVDQEHPALTEPEDINNPIRIRTTIHEHYLKKLNLAGHKGEENGLWLVLGYFVPHAHNIFLQISFDFGVISGACFIALVVCIYLTIIQYGKRKQGVILGIPFAILGGLTTVLVTFGMFEYSWGIGQSSFTLFFIAQYLLYHKEKQVAETGVE